MEKMERVKRREREMIEETCENDGNAKSQPFYSRKSQEQCSVILFSYSSSSSQLCKAREPEMPILIPKPVWTLGGFETFFLRSMKRWDQDF